MPTGEIRGHLRAQPGPRVRLLATSPIVPYAPAPLRQLPTDGHGHHRDHSRATRRRHMGGRQVLQPLRMGGNRQSSPPHYHKAPRLCYREFATQAHAQVDPPRGRRSVRMDLPRHPEAIHHVQRGRADTTRLPKTAVPLS